MQYPPECSIIWDRASLEIQLSDIRTSPTVANLLLTMLFATATTGRLDFLLNCSVTNTNTIIDILDKLPRIRSTLHAEDLDAILRSIHPQCPALLTWLCTSYAGFLVPATGIFRIPNMANQFLLANAAPNLERSFSVHFAPTTSASTTTPTRALFHGTSISRLLPILTQGLRVCSNTPLQANDRTHGDSIYMAEEPARTWSYATPITPALTWPRSVFRNVRVLLGCEYVATSQPRKAGILVIATRHS